MGTEYLDTRALNVWAYGHRMSGHTGTECLDTRALHVWAYGQRMSGHTGTEAIPYGHRIS